MANRANIIATCLLCSGLGVMTAAGYQQQPVEPDNTRANQRDRKATEPTADQQKGNKSDRNLARKIRRAIVQDKSISTYGHNVKVIVQNGAVTLKGPVHTEDEKAAIEAKAVGIAGAENVRNELSIKGDTADRKKSSR